MKRNLDSYRILSKITVVIMLLSVVLPIALWKQIPQQIPSHYDAAGIPDAWSGKESLILMFFLEFFVAGMMFLTGYSVKAAGISKHATEKERENLQTVYPMLGWMNLMIICMFAYLIFCSATCRNLGRLFLPVVLLGGMLPVFFCFLPGKKKGKAVKEEKERLQDQEVTEAGDCYRTKIDLWLAAVLIFALALPAVLSIQDYIEAGKFSWLVVVTEVILIPVIGSLFFIKYTLYEEHLKISCGLFGTQRIPYKNITSVKPTMNPLSSAAMSLKRVQIDYVEGSRHEMVLISPVKRKEFIQKVETKMAERRQV